MVRTPPTAPAATTPASKVLKRTPRKSPKTWEEKIRVTVRMRPLNRNEEAICDDDPVAWDCVDEHTIVFKNPNQDRERNAIIYSFDNVFAPTSSTKKVYEEGAKDVALSALSGINATIFAYGQTGSGKTFTMRGITENAIRDIYEYIKNTAERDFTLRVSGLEIYNESVIDLLNRDSGPLRILDDPEKGTIVEKLIEEVVKDDQHLRHLIRLCEAQRQVGATFLNDESSRSHQIIRLTIRSSSLRESPDHVKIYLASLNLVDLAGSERISQANTCGPRLKEGSHINKSLLTLTSVIRNLSCGKHSHISYRDSKLTRILQSSLGGNARTAIVCTISPALSQVEQTRNTLTFATSAKEIINNAQVNMVHSEKKLVRQLQQQVAKLEEELQSPEISSTSCLRTLLAEKDLKIHQMEKDIEELRQERDLARSQLELERTDKVNERLNHYRPSSQVGRCLSFSRENEPIAVKHTPAQREAIGRQAMQKKLLTSSDPSILVREIRKLESRQLQLCEDANRTLEILNKDFASHKLGSKEATETMSKILSEIKGMLVASSTHEDIVISDKANLMEEITRLKSQGKTIASLERKLEKVQNSIDKLFSPLPSTQETPESKNQLRRKKAVPFSLSNSPNMYNITQAPCSPLLSSGIAIEHGIENRIPDNDLSSVGSDTSRRLHRVTPGKDDGSYNSILLQEGSPATQQSRSVNVKKIQSMYKKATEENIRSIRVYITELKELVAKLQYQKQLLVCQVLELEANKYANEETDTTSLSPLPWHILFEEHRKQIIMLWHLCHISLVHRTQFYLVFRGDPSDQIYLEVELGRLTWLEHYLAELGNGSPALLGDEPAGPVSASIKALKQERDYLAKMVNTKLTAEERELLFAKWDVPPVGKHKRLQLVNKLWTDPYNKQHVQESAEIVGKLIDFCGSGEICKYMFELNFASPCNKKTWAGWKFISNFLNV